MVAKSQFGLPRKDRDSYLDLVTIFPLSSIRSEAHLAAAQTVMDRLLAKATLNDAEETYLDALSDLVAVYEDAHHAIEPASDAAMLQHLLEAKEISQSILSHATGIAKSSISEVLAGKKPFSRQMIRKLAEFFKIDVSILASNI